jgi:multicomponent Na+:H+ antiporter subunit G
MTFVAELLLLLGAALTLIAAIGVNRFRDVLARMHALSKATTLGLVFVLIGTTIGIDDANSATFAALAIALQLLTSPVASNLMARATYRAEGIPHRIDADDELAAAKDPDDGSGASA